MTIITIGAYIGFFIPVALALLFLGWNLFRVFLLYLQERHKRKVRTNVRQPRPNITNGWTTVSPVSFIKTHTLEGKPLTIGSSVEILSFEDIQNYGLPNENPKFVSTMRQYCGKKCVIVKDKQGTDGEWVRIDVDFEQHIWAKRWFKCAPTFFTEELFEV